MNKEEKQALEFLKTIQNQVIEMSKSSTIIHDIFHKDFDAYIENKFSMLEKSVGYRVMYISGVK